MAIAILNVTCLEYGRRKCFRTFVNTTNGMQKHPQYNLTSVKFWYPLEQEGSVKPAIDPARKGQNISIELQSFQIIFKIHINVKLASIILTKFPYYISFLVWVMYIVNCKPIPFIFLKIGLPIELYPSQSYSLDYRLWYMKLYYLQLTTIRCSTDYE